MKKFISLMLVLSSIFSIMIPAVLAEGTVSEEASAAENLWEYAFYGDGVELTGYMGDEEDVYIPGNLKIDGADYPVIKLGDGLFKDNEIINSATLSAGISEIGMDAFAGAKKLVCILTNNELASIGAGAFSGCTEFNSIILYDTVTSIGEGAFAGCEKLTIYCNENNTGYNYAVGNDIPYVILNANAEPEIVTIDGTTYYLSNGKAILWSHDGNANETPVIPPTVNGCPVTEIWKYAFSGGITSIELPNTLVNIGEGAFSGQRLSTLTLPDSVETIVDYAFNGCSKLRTLKLSKNLRTIGKRAFYNCGWLNVIEIYENVTHIGEYAFFGMGNLRELHISDMDAWCRISFENEYSNPLVYGSLGKAYVNGECVTEVTVPDGVSVLRYTFYDFTTLQSVTLPESVTIIGAYAFAGCTNLNSVKMSENVTVIERYAFNGSGISEIDLPDGLLEIWEYAFNCSNITYLKLPDSLETINEKAFKAGQVLAVHENTYAHTFAVEKGFSVIILNGDEEPELYNVDGVIYNINNGEAYAVGVDSSLQEAVIPEAVQGYPVVSIQSVFRNNTKIKKVTLPDSIKDIGDYAFSGCTSLSEIILPDSLLKIGKYAFSNCVFTSIIIPENVTFIDEGAFNYCQSLESIKIPDGITALSDGAFEGCSKLADVSLPDRLLSIGECAFRCCSALKGIDIPDSVTSIGDAAFALTGLETIKIPAGVTVITKQLFSSARSLSQVIMHEGITSIEMYAFNACDSLGIITLPKSVESIEGYSFETGVMYFVYENSYAYSWTESRERIVLAEGEEPEIYTVDGLTYYISDGNAVLVSCSTSLTDVTVPEKINGYPVTEIRNAFANRKNIVSVTLPDSLVKIGRNAFSLCSITSIVIPDGVTALEKQAFYYSDIKSITIPQSLASIKTEAFKSCSKLTDVYISDLKAWCDISFWGLDANPLYYAGRLHLNGELVTELVIPDGVEKIKPYAFGGMICVTELTLPASVESVGYSAFYECTGLTSIVLSEGVSKIDANAFDGCESLQSAVVPKSMTSFGEKAFHGCDKLREVYISDLEAWCGIAVNGDYSNPLDGNYLGADLYVNGELLEDLVIDENITEIKPNAFRGCYSLKSLTVLSDKTVIGSSSFHSCSKLSSVSLPDTIAPVGSYAFALSVIKEFSVPTGWTAIPDGLLYMCNSLKKVEIPDSVTSIGQDAFHSYSCMERMRIPEGVKSIGWGAFSQDIIYVPKSVETIASNAFLSTSLLCVYENSAAHTYAIKNGLLYFIIKETENPEISYSTGISGTVTYTDGTAASGAAVEVLYDDGTVKDSVITDENGAYSFPYAEVGRYTVRVTDSNGNTGSESVSVKRMNVFEVFLAGTTDIVLKSAWSISGSVVPVGNAVVTLTDIDGNIISSVNTEDGIYTIANVPNGTYILKAETEAGSAVKEITVFNSNIVDEIITIESQSATVTGYVDVEDRDKQHHRKSWVNVTIYNSEGVAVKSQKTNKDGEYCFKNLPIGDYSIVAEVSEIRPDKENHFDRPYTLTGYAYVSVTEAKTYEVDTIVLYEENDELADISGKVTAQGEKQACEVILRNVFRHEVDKCTTGNNGKYLFSNVRDGLYFVIAVTESKGMGFTVVTVRDGKIHGDTDIYVFKKDKIHEHEEKMNSIPHCNGREDALNHKDNIIEEKRFYDSLSEKEKKQFSKEYIERLNKLSEWISDCEYTENGGKIDRGGMIISGDELDNEDKIEIVLNVEKREPYEANKDKIKNNDDYIHHSVKDTAGHRDIVQYYDISLTKNVNGEEHKITNVCKDTATTGKLRITIPIPDEYKGHRKYSFVHVHNGVTSTLVDLDDDPDTVTFEIDRFSTFVLCYSDEVGSYPASISYDSITEKINVESTQNGTLYIAKYDEWGRLLEIKLSSVTADTSAEFEFDETKTAFMWDETMVPLCDKFEVGADM